MVVGRPSRVESARACERTRVDRLETGVAHQLRRNAPRIFIIARKRDRNPLSGPARFCDHAWPWHAVEGSHEPSSRQELRDRHAGPFARIDGFLGKRTISLRGGVGRIDNHFANHVNGEVMGQGRPCTVRYGTKYNLAKCSRVGRRAERNRKAAFFVRSARSEAHFMACASEKLANAAADVARPNDTDFHGSFLGKGRHPTDLRVSNLHALLVAWQASNDPMIADTTLHQAGLQKPDPGLLEPGGTERIRGADPGLSRGAGLKRLRVSPARPSDAAPRG